MAKRDYLAEFLGTAVLFGLGLCCFALGFSHGSPLLRAVPNSYLRSLITGTAFISINTALIYSPLGKVSGGHFNPMLTAAFYRLSKLTGPAAAAYVAAQVSGSLLGSWAAAAALHGRVDELDLGATIPRHGQAVWVFCIEFTATLLLTTIIVRFVDSPRLIPFTGLAAAGLGILVMAVEAPISRTSLNPLRTLGPAVMSDSWSYAWLYPAAALSGAFLAAEGYKHLRGEVACGKLIHDNRYTCHFVNCRYTPQNLNPKSVNTTRD